MQISRLIRYSLCILLGVYCSLDLVAANSLKVDFNGNNSATPPGWESFGPEDKDSGSPWSKQFSNGISIQVFDVGGVSLDTRDRGNLNAGNSEAAMWRDFLFANGSIRADQGLDIRVSGLLPGEVYPVKIWSFDAGSRVSRLSEWNRNRYSFNGSSPPPKSLDDHSVSFNLIANSNGESTIQARTGTPPGPAHNVFINGLEIGNLIQAPDHLSQIELSSNIANQSNPVGTILGIFSTTGAEPRDSFIYELIAGPGSHDNHYFEVNADQLLLAKQLDTIRPGSFLSLRVRSTDTNQESIEAIIQIQVSSEDGSVQPILINELVADNNGNHLDGDNKANDWIEIYNPRQEAVNLEGYSLTDDPLLPRKWIFPSITVPAEGYLILFGGAPEIDGVVQNDYRDAAGFYHFNFNLNASGEFLALVRPDGRTYEVVLDPGFPGQFTNISYGLNDRWEWNYYENPTPGAPNGNGFDGIIRDTKFSIDRGFYDSPLEVTLSTEEPDTIIRFTLDGSEPTQRNGQTYEQPISISTTSTLRAFAFREGWKSTDVDTHTYIFVDDVANQPSNPEGWPDNWGINSEVNNNDGSRNGTVPADYEMDPRVVDNTLPGYGIREALLDIPSVSIVMEQNDFIRPGSGIYAIPQSRIEKTCSMEYLLPDGTQGFQENCKIEVHGNSSRRPWRMQKHSLRLTFTSDLGAPQLDYPLFPESEITSFNKLILRACFTDSWGLVSWGSSRYRPNDSQYIRDVWMKESLRDMGQPSSYGNFVHLYINGLYFGLHNLTERLEDDFFAAHLGGNREDWEINEDFSSPGRRWNQMMQVDASTPEGYAEIQNFVDLENFADYMLLHFYADSEDWPHHNGYAAANANSGDGRFRFYVWDQEIVLDKFTWNRYDRSDGVGAVFQKLRQNPEFRMIFADRVQKHLGTKGALSMGQSQERYLNLANQIDKAIVAESARWGDTQASTPYGNRVQQPNPLTNVDHDHYPPAPHAPDIYFTREDSWLVERDNVLNHYIPTLHNPSSRFAILNELRDENLFPDTPAPELSINPGHISPGTAIELNADVGVVYYTLDGSDPRQANSIVQTMLLNDRSNAMAAIPRNDTWQLNWIEEGFVEDSTWKRGTTGIGYETSPADYKGFIGLNVSEMRNQNGSVYIRVPFVIEEDTNLDSFTHLRLDMRYDDGFIAYLNGTRIAQANAPIGAPSWNSLARATNPDSAATTFEAFDITRHLRLLKKGENLLAVHGLNGSLTSSDLLITPRLVASRLDDSQQDQKAQTYQEPILLSQSSHLKARTFHNAEWSALIEGFYTLETPASHDNLVISEIMYHPMESENLEFIELLNISEQTLSLSGLRFTSGIDFEFVSGSTLAPGRRYVIARSPQSLSSLTPGITIAGEFQNGTGLSNGGERIELIAGDGSIIQSFRYDDRLPWPEKADGNGPSLVLKDPFDNPDPNEPSHWKLSIRNGGSPGTSEPSGFTGEPKADQDGDGLPAIAEYYFGTDDLEANDPSEVFTVSIEPFPTAEIPGDYLTISMMHQTNVKDVQAFVEFSEDLEVWSSEANRVIAVSNTPQQEGREQLKFRSATPLSQQKQEFVRLSFIQ